MSAAKETAEKMLRLLEEAWQQGHDEAIAALRAEPASGQLSAETIKAVRKHWDNCSDVVALCDMALRSLTARDEGIEAAAKQRSLVPVLPGDMPDEMWATISTDRDAATQALRIIVEQTLDEYEQAIRALKGRS